jgi:membrane-associated protease RseP (regulator of RpoE activity)
VYSLLAVGLLFLAAAWVLLASALARHLAVLALGARGSRFAFGAPRWAWTERGAAKRALVAAAGALGSYLAAGSFVTVALLAGGEPTTDEASMRVGVDPRGPAARAGMQDGDKIVLIERLPVHDWDELKAAVRVHPGEPIDIVFERDGARTNVTVAPDANGKIKVGPFTYRASVGVGKAVKVGLVIPAEVLGLSARALIREFAGSERPELSGPVGIVRETSRTAQVAGVWMAVRMAGALAGFLWPFTIVWALIMAPGGGGRRRPDRGGR